MISGGKRLLFSSLAAASLFAAACSTVVDAHTAKSSMMSHYLAGDYGKVMDKLDDRLRPPAWYNDSVVGTGDEIMWRLEAGSMNFLLGKDDASLAHFEAAEERIADFDDRAKVNLREAGAETAVLFTNPNALPYRGLCRDRIMLPVFKAFAYLGKNDEEAFRVELFRLREVQEKVLADYQEVFEKEEKAMETAQRDNAKALRGINIRKIFSDGSNAELSQSMKETESRAQGGYADFMNPFAIFLSGYGYARDRDFENALVDFERLRRALPGNALAERYYAEAARRAGRPVKPLSSSPRRRGRRPSAAAAPAAGEAPPLGRNSVLVVFANGRSASLRQFTLYIPVVFPGYATLAAVAWPLCEYYDAPFSGLTVQADGRTTSAETLVDMDAVLSREYEERLPGMIARVVLSTAVKEFGSYAATRAAARANQWAGLAVGVTTTVYKIIMNTADTRTWEILPKEIRIAHIPLPGNRTLRLSVEGGPSLDVSIPPSAGSAIVYLSAPSRQSQPLCRVFPLHHKP